MRRLIVSALGVALLFGVLAAGHRTPKRPPHVLGTQVERKANPLGLKGGLNQIGDHSGLETFAKDAGGGATFYEFVWCDIESERGKPDWSATDEIARSTTELGMRLFVKIRVGSCWATQGGDTHRTANAAKAASVMPASLSTYSSFVRALVTRYAAKGVHEYAIENETNATNFWQSSAAQYEQLAKTGAAAVRAADPKARVLDSGLSSPAYGLAISAQLLKSGPSSAALRFYNAFFARRAAERGSRFPKASTVDQLRAVLREDPAQRAQAFVPVAFRLARAHVVDAWQLHYYDPWGVLPDVLNFIHAGAGASFPIEAWETGVLWPGKTYDPAIHAAETAKLFSLLLSAGAQRFIYLPLVFDPSSGHDELWRGLYSADGTQRAAARVFQRFVAMTSGTDVTWHGVKGDVRGTAFQTPSGCALVLWSSSTIHYVGAPPSGVTATDATGAPLRWDAKGFSIGDRPVILTGRGKADVLLSELDRRRDRHAR